MNVLFHHRTRGREVEGVHIRGIVGAMRGLGHRVDVVSPPGVNVEHDGEGPPAARRAGPGFDWSRFSARAPEALFEGVEVAYNAWAGASLGARLVRRDYRFIYDRYALFSVAAILAARGRGVPIVLEVNDSATVDRVRPLRLVSAARAVERFVWRAADAIVTISHYFRDLIIEAGVPAARVHVIANAVDESDFGALPDRVVAGQSLGFDDRVVIGYVGAINHWRRLDLLLEAFAELAPRHPRAHLLIIGDGVDRAAMEAEVGRRALTTRVTFAGRISHVEIGPWLATLDVAVIPHSNEYGSPMKLFEYMAAGKVVVAPWLPPIASVIGDDDGGVLFAPLDGVALARALEGLIVDPERRARLGARAREKVLKDYVWRRHAEAILGIQAGLSATRAGRAR